MIFKVFSKTNNKHSKFISDETMKQIKERTDDSIDIKFYDMDELHGKQIANDENISYIPTVICEHDDYELGYIENRFAIGHSNMVDDMNHAAMWWKELSDFVYDMIENRKKTKDVI